MKLDNFKLTEVNDITAYVEYRATVVKKRWYWFNKKVEVFSNGVNWRYTDTGDWTPGVEVEDLYAAYFNKYGNVIK